MNIKGYTYGFMATKGMYESEEGKYSQDRLIETGINWVCIAFPLYQDTFTSTEIKFDLRNDVSDLELISTIKRFHDNNVKVCLKPMVNCKDDIWRAYIDFPDEMMHNGQSYWDKWFESYQAFLEHYARIAEYTGCEMFCLGCEMLGTERKEAHWRKTITAVKEIYSGPLVYNTNHGKEEIAKWYDMIDYIGTSAYYPVEKEPGGSLEEMEAVWESVADRLEGVSKRLGKKVIFMEIGCRSAKGCAMMPWDFTHTEYPRSEEEQANFYESCLKVMSKRDWFDGFFWWDWSTHIYHTKEEATRDVGFNIHMKKAEEVVKEWYKKM